MDLSRAAELLHEHFEVLLALMLLLLLVQTLRLWWVRGQAARRMNRHRKAGQVAERRAIVVLERRGYRLQDAQAQASYALLVNGSEKAVQLRADFRVKKGGKNYVVEVKSGEESARLNRATRRQLLEYHLAFDVDGVLLLDMHRELIFEVSFPLRRR